jgi:AraC family transcriptional regulator of adaptative response/methylated-DNA-[protein]-cysteine methyltransferase
VAGDELALARAIALIAEAESLPSLAEMAAAAGYSPHHFHRLFRKATGVTPAAYARAVRAGRMEKALGAEADVTAAVYAAGYAAPTRFYADADRRLGMTPSVWRRGGEGVTIRWTIIESDLGALLFAVTDRGVCRLAFGEDEGELRRRFPRALVERAGERLQRMAAQAVAAMPALGGGPDVSLAVRRMAFEEGVRDELERAFRPVPQSHRDAA